MSIGCRILVVGVLLVASACGGSSSSTPTVPGSMLLDTEYPRSVNSSGGQTGGGQMHVGEYWTNTDLESRGAWLFDLTALPAGSVVTQATLKIYVTGGEGTPSDLHPLDLDHDGRPAVTPPQGGDFALAYDDEGFTQLNFAVLGAGEPPSWTVDVTGVVGSAWDDGAAASVFRLRSTTAPIVNGVIDAYLVGGQWSGDLLDWYPTLEIDYLAP